MTSKTEIPNAQEKIVVFDGECVLCNRFFQFLLKKDKKKTLKYAILQSDWAKNKLTKLFVGSKIPDSVIFITGDKVYTRSSAALRIVGSLTGFWFLARILLIIPPFIRNTVYDIIARNRFDWWGKTTCLIPDSAIKNQFVDWTFKI